MSRFTRLKMKAYNANMEISRKNLAICTWGNVSVMDKKNRVFAIKPSGVLYRDLKAEDMVVVDLEHTIIEGNLNPSSDTRTHIVLYRAFTWGETASKAVDNAVVLEELAKMAFITKIINPDIPVVGDVLRKKHYERKNGRNVYYGQS